MQNIIGTVQTLPQKISGCIKPTAASSGEEYQKGFEEGKKEGYDSGFENGFADGKEQGFEEGKNSVIDICNYAKTLTFESMNVFGKSVVELNVGKVSTLDRMFYGTTSDAKNTIVEHLTINHNGQPTSMYEMICTTGSSSDDRILKKLTLNIDTSKCQYFKNFVRGKYGLTIIDGKPIDFSSNIESTITTFTSCSQITEFRVVKGTIKQSFNVSASGALSNETIQSIIDGLADLTGQTTQTITWHTNVSLKLTDEQYQMMINKNWNVR